MQGSEVTSEGELGQERAGGRRGGGETNRTGSFLRSVVSSLVMLPLSSRDCCGVWSMGVACSSPSWIGRMSGETSRDLLLGIRLS